MKRIFLLGLIAVASFYYSSAKAGVLIEPYLGTLMMSEISGDTFTELNDLDDDNATEESITGMMYGARLGYGIPGGIMAGLDYTMASGKLDDYESKLTEYGVFVGFQLPMIRFWATYMLSSTFTNAGEDEDTEDPITLDFLKGSGYKVGVGYSPLPMLSINFEMRSITYTEMSITNDGDDIFDGTAPYTGDLDFSEHENTWSSYLLSVSVPIDL